MNKPPAVIIVARHGARLDAEDNDWTKTASAPYDPPLSYGGWTQTRALGARIASILRERDIAIVDEEIRNKRRGSDDAGSGKTRDSTPQKPATSLKRRKRKVVVHTSPFLRCIQSSIAISAGMAQYEGNLKKFEAAHRRVGQRSAKISTPSRSHTLDASALDAKYTNGKNPRIPNEANEHPAQCSEGQPDFWKPTLRVDAFLGEWLSPDYFEFITAPPDSYMMVAGAKADLMRRGSPLQGAQVAEDPHKNPARGWQNGLSNGRRSSSQSYKLDDIAEALPDLGESAITNGIAHHDYASSPTQTRPRFESISNGYTPPIPTYAISTSEAIPPGFVSHARDACVRLDFQWDSEREPQAWGNGGEHGEEWSSMHRRFRRGLMEMIGWYKKEGPYYDPQATDEANGPEISTEDDEELVLVLVTHGAGCNALIGALTNQPVLLDVGMGSLTMAVHKGIRTTNKSPPPVRRQSSVPTRRRRSSVDTSQAEEYEMKYTASAEHLRAGADPLKIPALQSPHLAAIPESRRGNSTNSSDGTLTPELELPTVKNAALGSIRRNRALTLGSNRTASGDSSGSGSSGLWGDKSATMHQPTDTLPSRESSFNEADDQPAPAGPKEIGEARKPETHIVTQSPLEASPKGKGGLWGSAPPKKQPVRRWTVNEHD